MASVTIEGSLTPCEDLPRGRRVTVALTPTVQRRIDRGFYLLIATHDSAPAETVADSEQVREASEVAPPPAGEQKNSDGRVVVGTVPSNNASREKWSAFLAIQEPPISVPEDAPRDGLVHIWQQASGGS